MGVSCEILLALLCFHKSIIFSIFLKASVFLNANGAEYPMRIVYSSPQYYSVEALEVSLNLVISARYKLSYCNTLFSVRFTTAFMRPY